MSYAKLVLITLGLGVATASAVRYATDEAWAARGWPVTQGRVISSDVAVKQNYISARGRMTKTRNFEPNIVYRYSVGGVERTGSRVWAADRPIWNSRAGADTFIAGYKMFGPVQVHYDPDAPQESFLVQNSPSISWIFLAIFGLLVAWLGTKAKGRDASAPTSAAGRTDGAPHALDDPARQARAQSPPAPDAGTGRAAPRDLWSECELCDSDAPYSGVAEEDGGLLYGLFYCPQCKETFRVWRTGFDDLLSSDVRGAAPR